MIEDVYECIREAQRGDAAAMEKLVRDNDALVHYVVKRLKTQGREYEDLYQLGRLGLVRAVGDGHTIIFVQDILVRPDYQRQGIGSALLRAVLERYADVRQIELVTDNTPETRVFYQSAGFQELSEIDCCGFMKT